MNRRQGWRTYQRKLRAGEVRRRLVRRLPRLVLYGAAGFLCLALATWAVFSTRDPSRTTAPEAIPGAQATPSAAPGPTFHLEALLNRLPPDPGGLLATPIVELDGERYRVETSLDPDLQSYIERLLGRAQTLRAAVVVLRPRDGAVLALAQQGEEDSGENLFLQADSPAASLIKIVTATAALEWAGYQPGDAVRYEGRKYSLYKRQLGPPDGAKGAKTTLKRAFALSINPVFGRLGIYALGREVLAEYAERFLFNRTIPFDFALANSPIDVPDEAFGIAEIASGFNKRTLISPVHAALLAAAVANDGMLMAPWLVAGVTDSSGQRVFERHPAILGTPMSSGTAQSMQELMGETIRHGTGRKSFAALRRRKTGRELRMGGKTGSINDPTDRFKYDWFAGYALPKQGGAGICLAVLGVHGEKLGVRAHELASRIIRHYYNS